MDDPSTLVWLDDPAATDVALAGAKAATLAELLRWPAGDRPSIPPAFVVSTAAVTTAGVRIPAGVLDEALERLGTGGRPGVAVRTSAVDEDRVGRSRAGRYRSELGVPADPDSVRAAIERCAAGRAAARPRADGIAVMVQRLAHDGSGVSGVAFSRLPEDPDRDVVVIETEAGLGGVVGGHGRPERTILVDGVQRDDGRGDGGARPRTGSGGRRLLAPGTVRELADWLRRAEARTGHPVDVEFAVPAGGAAPIVVQLRPLTGLGRQAAPVPPDGPAVEAPPERGPVVVRGIGVGSGRVRGPVCRLDRPDELDRLVPGGVLVTTSTDPSWLAVLDEVAAVVTDAGGSASHAAIVCRELRLPAVVGCGDATSRLRHGVVVEVTAGPGVPGEVRQV